MNKLKKFFTSVISAAMVAAPSAALAQGVPSVGFASGTLQTVIVQASTYIAMLAGAIAILMVIYGGIQYMVSGEGDGKKTVIQGLAGLAIVILAYVLVRTVVAILGV